MANPAPIISSISAFDKGQGTTIYYNVIGATELIRASRIQIYAVSDNSLKLEYLYTGTMQSGGQYQLVLPSSETSGTLTNGTQYYARIETYTSINGSTGASGYSVAKIFYCLATPSLTAPTMPAQVNTTTYNAIFTYTYTGAVDNRIQQYELELLEGTTVRETSGVIVGTGTQTASQTYQVSYNFSTLENNKSYTIRCTVLTTQGMVKSQPTSLFQCEISAPSFSAASVTNNACGGYITISSQITNIEGVYHSDTQTNPTYLNDGGVWSVDLTNDDYVEWTTGLTVASVGTNNNWTLHMWCRDVQPIESFVQDLALVYLGLVENGEVKGKMGAFITKNSDGTKIRLEFLVDMDGTEGNIATYHTPYIDTPLTTDNLYVRIRCTNNWFSVTLINLDDTE